VSLKADCTTAQLNCDGRAHILMWKCENWL